jgi:hypothetical protein
MYDFSGCGLSIAPFLLMTPPDTSFTEKETQPAISPADAAPKYTPQPIVSLGQHLPEIA